MATKESALNVQHLLMNCVFLGFIDVEHALYHSRGPHMCRCFFILPFFVAAFMPCFRCFPNPKEMCFPAKIMWIFKVVVVSFFSFNVLLFAAVLH